MMIMSIGNLLVSTPQIMPQVEENTSQSMKMLMELDTVKSRMQAASSALQVYIIIFETLDIGCLGTKTLHTRHFVPSH